MQDLQAGHTAYIGLGANLGDRLATLRAAVEHLAGLGRLLSASGVYETDPVGFLEQPAFLNAVVALETKRAPSALVTALLAIERQLGRVRTFPNAPRAIDLDLLLYDDAILDSTHVTVPHPRLHERAFVLVPLNDLAPDLRHPRLNLTVHDLLRRLEPIRGVARTSLALDDLAREP